MKDKTNDEMARNLNELLIGQKVLRVGTNAPDGRVVIEFEGTRLILLDRCKFEVVELETQ